MAYNFITDRGVIVPDFSETRAEVEAVMRSAFGDDIDLSPETPQGVLVTILAEARDSTARNNAQLANQINPDIAGGVFLDALYSLMSAKRRGKTKSIIPSVKLSGVPGTFIPAGSIATTSIGDEFESSKSVILDSKGSAIVDFVAREFGAIEVPPNDLEQIASSVLGWESVSNSEKALVGRESESDIAARRRRRYVLALNSSGVNKSVISRLYEIDEVNSLSFRENFTKSPIVEDGVTIKHNSIYVCVDGGTDEQIARAIKASKSLGCNTSGSQSYELLDEITGQKLTYYFDRPTEKNLTVRVHVKQSNIDAKNLVPKAVQAMVNGDVEGDEGLVVGRSISPFEISAAINFAEPYLFVTKVELSMGDGQWSSDTVNIKINEIARIQPSATNVVIV